LVQSERRQWFRFGVLPQYFAELLQKGWGESVQL